MFAHCSARRRVRRAARLLRQVAAGSKVSPPEDAAVWERLLLSGAVRVDPNGRSACRNRVIKELVNARWIKPAAKRSRWVAVAAVLLAVLAAGGYWYARYLPDADIATLSSPARRLAESEEAYRRLRGLPGFAARAEALWSEALATGQGSGDDRGRRPPSTLVCASSRGRMPRQICCSATSGCGAHASRARRAARRGDTAGATRGGIAERGLRRGRLPRRARRRRLHPPRAFAAPCRRAEVVACGVRAATLLWFDAQQQALRTPFGPAGGTARDAAPLELTALQHVSLVRELTVAGDGTAGELELSLTVQHAAGAELRVTLAGPSGATAAIDVPPIDGIAVETVQFSRLQGSPLAELADEARAAFWTLTIVDRAAGNTGVLFGWTLTRGSDVARDDPSEPLAIPDPHRVDAVELRVVGERAVVWPTMPGAIGTVALWNLATGISRTITRCQPPAGCRDRRDRHAHARRDRPRAPTLERHRRHADRESRYADRVRAPARVFGGRRPRRDRRARRRSESAL